MDGTGDTDATRLGEAFQTGRNIDAIAVDLDAVDDDVAEIDTDAELHPAVGREVGVF
jgi:hypothetical protein